MNNATRSQARICYVVAPYGQAGGGMGRVANYLTNIGGDDLGKIRFVALNARGPHILLSPFYVLAALVRIAIAKAAGQLALVHINMGERTSVLRKGIILLGARTLNVPVVLHLHAAEIFGFYDSLPGGAQRMCRSIFHQATCCIVLGEPWRKWLVESLGVNPGKVIILYNGVPDSTVKRTRHAGEGGFRILFLGNLMERKGVSDLINALALLPKENMHWQATFAGGGALKKYQEQSESLGLSERITFAGWVNQDSARSHLAASDILILPSYEEGLPLVILEAFAAGVAVICTPVGCIPEVIENNRDALFVKPGDTQGIAAALKKMIAEPALCDAIARQGQALYYHRFTMHEYMEQLFCIYREYCKIDVGGAGQNP